MGRVRGLAWTIIGLGAIGFIIPFVGPLFNFGMGPDPAFVVTSGRVLRHVLPGAVVVLGGLLMLSGSEGTRRLGAAVAVFGGVWLGVYPWASDVGGVGQFIRRGVYHWGTGLAVLALASFALGRITAARMVDLRRYETRADRPSEVGV